MNDLFTAEFFSGNRARLRQLFSGTAPIVLAANGLLQRGGDAAFCFAQDASFWYLTGIEDPDVILVLDKYKDFIILPEHGETRVTFDGRLDAELISQKSGIAEIMNSKNGWKHLAQRLKKVSHVATLPVAPVYIEAAGMYVNPARRRLRDQIKSLNASIELLDISKHIARQRCIKQPAEIAALQAAIDVTIDTFQDILRPDNLAKYQFEYQIEADISRGLRFRGAAGHAFEPIVAGGERACTVHNFSNNAQLQSGELLVLDVGAEAQHYAADISRTVALNNHPSPRQLAVHEAVSEVQDYALSLLKPGLNLKNYEPEICNFMGEKLRELGLIKTILETNVRQFYPHSTSHFIGLNVHDVGDYSQPLAPGMVLSCEPGIYIKDESIGVRIEDDVLITPEGNQVLSRRLPRGLV
ncbi:MAG: aminopeptidase P N-terminal domain-containing protein [Candidatus Saccharimonadales bacterium]